MKALSEKDLFVSCIRKLLEKNSLKKEIEPTKEWISTVESAIAHINLQVNRDWVWGDCIVEFSGTEYLVRQNGTEVSIVEASTLRVDPNDLLLDTGDIPY